MRILLVRHAHAGVRGTWPGDDLERELSERGQAEATSIAKAWAGAGVTAVHSSRAVRCVETVRPLADQLGLVVQERAQLLEGAAPGDALAWLEALEPPDDGAVVACSHGDVIGGIIERLADRGTPLEGDVQWPKASTWELAVDDRLVVRGQLHTTPPTPEPPDRPTT